MGEGSRLTWKSALSQPGHAGAPILNFSLQNYEECLLFARLPVCGTHTLCVSECVTQCVSEYSVNGLRRRALPQAGSPQGTL